MQEEALVLWRALSARVERERPLLHRVRVIKAAGLRARKRGRESRSPTGVIIGAAHTSQSMDEQTVLSSFGPGF